MFVTATEVLAHGGDWGGGAWWPIFPLFWVLLWIFVIGAFFRFRRGRGPWHPEKSGESVLAERFARGEIDEDEYRKRIEVLKRIGK